MTTGRIFGCILFLLISSRLGAQGSEGQIIFNRHFDSRISAFSMSESGQFVVVGTEDGYVSVTENSFNKKRLEEFRLSIGRPVASIAVSANGKVVSVAS